MPTMSEVIADHTDMGEVDHTWLRLLVSEWQLLADLSFGDLVLWVPDRDPNLFWAAAQIRPTTGHTALLGDVVGDLIAYSPEHLVSTAHVSGEITGSSANAIQVGLPVDIQAIPVWRHGEVIAVVERHTNQLSMERPSVLEEAYLASADDLAQMVSQGLFPKLGEGIDLSMSPRVGDGFVRLDVKGFVTYASPNGLSAYRRLGLHADLDDENLMELTTDLIPTASRPVDKSMHSVLAGASGGETELVNGDAHVLLRAVPIMSEGERTGAIVLCRDVTDLRSRERALVTKDATIREIHHRVKNNLQTVAALLRMQARRIAAPEARAALRDANSRVASIALVHEILSQAFDEEVDFDLVADQVLNRMADMADADRTVRPVREGSFGRVSADVATSLSLIVTELCQNAVEHGVTAEAPALVVRPERRSDGRLRVEVLDGGRGLPADFALADLNSLGLSIVSTLVTDLGGTFDLGANPAGTGTRALVELPQAN
ncbi:MAG: sensor histidine kinase [Propionibacteriaceae bacterium]